METQDKMERIESTSIKGGITKRRAVKIVVMIAVMVLLIGLVVGLAIYFNRQARDMYDLEKVKTEFVAFYGDDGVEVKDFEVVEGLFNLDTYNVKPEGMVYLANFDPTDVVAKLPDEPFLILLVEGQTEEATEASYREIEGTLRAFGDGVVDGVEDDLKNLHSRAILVRSNNYYYLIMANDPTTVELELKSLNPITSPLKSRIYEAD